MKKIVIIGLSLILGLGLVAIAVMAQGPGFGRGFGMGPGYGPPGNFFANLTPEQSAQDPGLTAGTSESNHATSAGTPGERNRATKPVVNPNADPAVIGVKQKEIWDLRSNLQEMTTNLRLQIREVLTPEQQAQFDTFGPGRGMGPRMGRGPGPGFGPGRFWSGRRFWPRVRTMKISKP